jgi:periplasmic protein CpxP/Spy
MKSNRFFTFILSGAMVLPMAALAQTGSTASGDNSNAATTQTQPKERGERGEKFAKELNLTPEQQADMKSIRENMKQQAQAIKNDSSLTADQKKAKFKELRKSSHEQMMAKLTPDQQAKFKEMKKEHRGNHRHGRKGEAAPDKTQS